MKKPSNQMPKDKLKYANQIQNPIRLTKTTT